MFEKIYSLFRWNKKKRTDAHQEVIDEMKEVFKHYPKEL